MLEKFLGNKDTKKEIDDLITQMLRPAIFYTFGVQPDKSFLFYGPPGNGKTFSIEHIRKELSKKGKKYAKMHYDIGKYGTAYINMGSRNLQDFFNAGKMLLHTDQTIKGIMYVFDEAEVLLGKRGSLDSHKEDDKVTETLMKNMQKIHDGDSEYLFFMTNLKDFMDDAALRSGRIDKQVEFTNPDYRARVEFFEHVIKQTNKYAKYQVIKNIKISKLANYTNGFNCIDIEEIPRRALKSKLTDVLKSSKKNVIGEIKITENDLVKEIKQIGKTKKRRWSIGFK